MRENWPDVYAALAQFSGKLPDGLDGFTYWSKEKVGPRASVTLTHVIIRPPIGGVAVIASKQIYASHYVTASLGLTVLVDQGSAAGPRTLLVYMNRTRVDLFGGFLGGVKRPLVRSRAKSGAERMIGTCATQPEIGHGTKRKRSDPDASVHLCASDSLVPPTVRSVISRGASRRTASRAPRCTGSSAGRLPFVERRPAAPRRCHRLAIDLLDHVARTQAG